MEKNKEVVVDNKNMTNLVRFDSEGIELVINTDNGEAFATQRGYARMSGRNSSTISRRCAKPDVSPLIKEAEMDTGYGVKLVALISADLVYEWLLTDNLELAKAMGKAGATTYLHQLAGYKVFSNAITSNLPQTYIQALEALVLYVIIGLTTQTYKICQKLAALFTKSKLRVPLKYTLEVL